MSLVNLFMTLKLEAVSFVTINGDSFVHVKSIVTRHAAYFALIQNVRKQICTSACHLLYDLECIDLACTTFI
jgi:hypothetical protein